MGNDTGQSPWAVDAARAGNNAANHDLFKIDLEIVELRANGTVDATKNIGNVARATATIPTTNIEAAELEELPDTGVGLEKERILSPILICTPVYGTRS